MPDDGTDNICFFLLDLLFMECINDDIKSVSQKSYATKYSIKCVLTKLVIYEE